MSGIGNACQTWRGLLWGALLACGAAAAGDGPMSARLAADQAVRAGNYATASELYRGLAVEYGDPDSQFMLGHLYAQGLGVAADAAEALRWMVHAAQNGSAAALHWLASPENNSAPRLGMPPRSHWLLQAAASGDVASLNELLDRREEFDAVDAGQLLEWTRHGAESNRPEALLLWARALRELAPERHADIRRALQAVLNKTGSSAAQRAAAAAALAADLGLTQAPLAVQYFWRRVAVQGGVGSAEDVESFGLALSRPVRAAADQAAAEYWQHHPDRERREPDLVDDLTAVPVLSCDETAVVVDAVERAAAHGAAPDDARRAAEAALKLAAMNLSGQIAYQAQVGRLVGEFYEAADVALPVRVALVSARCR